MSFELKKMAPAKFAYSFLASLLILSTISCSKKDQSIAAPVVKNCKIISATVTNGTGAKVASYTYKYDVDGKLTGSTYSGLYSDTVHLLYNGAMIYRTFSSSIYSSFDTIILNAAGLIEYRKEASTDGIYITNYAYNGNMELQNFIIHQDPYPADSVYYSFISGDAVSRSEGPITDSMTYDISKTAAKGNMDEFSELLADGAMFVRNKHLISSVRHYNSVAPASNSVTAFTYEYTPEGNISSIKTTSGNSQQTISYVYDCN